MIGTAFAPEPLPDADMLRTLIRDHRVSHCEVLACRCALFYQEALVELHSHSVERVNVIRACMEALLSASQCMLEHRTVVSDPEQSKALGNLATYAFIQAMTQIIESITGLEEALKIDITTIYPKNSSIKDRDYWKFRNRHSHVVNTRRSARSKDDPESANHHVFRLGRTSADRIFYMTLSETGFMARSVSTDQIAWGIQADLAVFFDAALVTIRSHPKR